MKIAVYAISKNEEQFVERFTESRKGADQILICDTGSTDSTVMKALSMGATVHNIMIKPWRFDKARDAALALVDPSMDVVISLDLDEVLEPGWRQEIESKWKSNTTRMRYGYDWGQGIIFKYEKIHSRFKYTWHHPCHEYPRIDPREEEVWCETNKILVRHYPDLSKSRSQYLELLKLSIIEDPACPRNAFYYARELTFWKQWEEAIKQLSRYLDMNSGWVNERCYAMRLMAKCYQNLGNDLLALKYIRLACSEAPNTREPWYDLAFYSYQKENWLECYYAAKKVLSITNREEVYTNDPMVWGAAPHDLLSVSAWNLENYLEAHQHAVIAHELNPNDQRILDNVTFMQRYIEK